jgi:hypothetical protein
VYDRPRFLLLRRLLLPYSGEQVLTYKQGLRVIIAWALFFGLVLSLASLPVELAFMQTVSPQKVALLFSLSFLTGGIIFGGLALLVVMMGNRAARILQSRKAEKADQ